MTADTTFFDFDSEESDAESLPPACTFRLGGKDWTVRNKDLVPFSAVQAITAATELGAPIAIGPFFAGVLEPEQVEDFMATLASPAVTLRKATDAARFVLLALHGRPTTPSATSTAGRKPTGRKSAGGSSSPATRKRRSAS